MENPIAKCNQTANFDLAVKCGLSSRAFRLPKYILETTSRYKKTGPVSHPKSLTPNSVSATGDHIKLHKTCILTDTRKTLLCFGKPGKTCIAESNNTFF